MNCRMCNDGFTARACPFNNCPAKLTFRPSVPAIVAGLISWAVIIGLIVWVFT